MKTIRLYRHPDCAKCARYARMHHRFDWLDRLDDSTLESPTGPIKRGEIAVEDIKSGLTLRGIECFRLLCRNIPAYWPMLPITYIPFVRRAIENDIGKECSDAGDAQLT